MDGNGRWARERGLPRLEGHRAGTQNLRRVLRGFGQHGVRYLTIYAFSTENWSRPKEEVVGVWELASQVLRNQISDLHAEGVRVIRIGNRERLSPALQQDIEWAEALTKDNTRMTLVVALDYGGRDEIVRAIRRMLAAGLTGEAITAEAVASHLDTAGLPDPDLVIRTGGEMRLSNYLLWQSAYAEYYSTPACWPDFDEHEIELALAAYRQRNRKFGGLGQPASNSTGTR